MTVAPQQALRASLSGGRHRVHQDSRRENSLRALISHTAILTHRVLLRWFRDPATMAETLLVPVAFLVTLNIVLGDGISQVTGQNALYGSVPLVAMVAATQGATVGGLAVMRERAGGLLSRMWVLPIHRAAGVLSRLLGEAVRIIAATLALMVTGLILGMRFEQGILAAVGWVFVPCIFGLAFSIAVITVALFSARNIVVEATALVSGLFMFFSTGFVPLDQYPDWLQPAVEHQPLSFTVELMRGLSAGGPLVEPLLGLLAWSGGLVALCAVPLAIGYRKASTRGEGVDMFASSSIRKLARSEEMFAETHNFVGLGAHLRGPVDVDALSDAFDMLLEVHPVLGGHLERGQDGRWEIVVDDLMHPGIIVVQAEPGDAVPPLRFDQTETLVHLRLIIRGSEVQPTLYVHHCLADGHHQFSLIEELFSYYTDIVAGSTPRTPAAQPAPASLEAVLAERGIVKQQRSGLERFMPAMFAYQLPPSRRSAAEAKPTVPLRVPMSWCLLSEEQTQHVIDFCRANRVSLNGVLSAVILMAEWQLRGRRNIPVPYIYPVDLRYLLSPPVTATAATNPVGVATYLAEIDGNTTVLELARDIAETFRADVAEGVIAQSLLHFSPQYVGNPPGLPDVVMLTDNGIVPPMRTPADVELISVHGELFFEVSSGIEMYTSKVFNGQLMVEYHTHGPDPEQAVATIQSLLEDLDDHSRAGVR